MKKYGLRLTGDQHRQISAMLFPGDENEAVVFALCGTLRTDNHHILTVREIVSVPSDCYLERTTNRVRWMTEFLPDLLDKAMQEKLALLKIHSHPGGLKDFSGFDDETDIDLFRSVYGWFDDDIIHASAIMTPDGELIARVITPTGQFIPVSKIAVAGDDLYFWFSGEERETLPAYTQRHAQAFGEGTAQTLRQLSVAVVGCSGTGSPVVEQLKRLGVGRLVLVDPDRVEEKNLNRILGATMEDAQQGRFKVDVLADEIARTGLGTEVLPLPKNLHSPDVVKAVAECDVIFGCVDSVDGRHLLNRLAVYYLNPFFDVGIRLDADGNGSVNQICGTVHYLQADRSSLLSRGVYTLEQLRAADLKRTSPEAYQEQLQSKYIIGVAADRPAVISINMHFASLAVNEFLLRLHRCRDDSNADYAIHCLSLTQGAIYSDVDNEPCSVFSRHVGRGDVNPLLNLPSLSEELLGGGTR
ncbi:MAG: ThiF family adenylyltransferase [Acidobacteria bacterium]|nr:ThiF family adenylyltransferase [Acidobacteriota bacterium]